VCGKGTAVNQKIFQISRSVELPCDGARRVPLFVVDVKQSSLRSIDTNPPALPSSGSLELLSSSLSGGSYYAGICSHRRVFACWLRRCHARNHNESAFLSLSLSLFKINVFWCRLTRTGCGTRVQTPTGAELSFPIFF
jgi:hypothetical protein